MNNDLTINSLSFVHQYSDKDSGSVRNETSRGVNLPEILSVRNRQITLSDSKLPARQTTVRLDRHVAASDNSIVKGLECHMVVTVPASSAVGTADVQACVTRLLTLLAGTTVTGGMDLKDEIFVNQEQ